MNDTMRQSKNDENIYFVKVNMAFVKTTELTDGELRLLQIIMIRAYTSGECYQSKNNFAEDSGTSKKTIKRRVAALKEKGYITVHPHKNKYGGNSNDKYRLTEKSKQLIGK